MRIALVYDRLNKLGGAEVILRALHALYPRADWYTSVWDPARVPFSRAWRVHTPWFGRLPLIRAHHEWFPWLMPFVFEAFDLSDYDLVISVGSAECQGVITRPGTRHLHYCLTPTRYLYSHSAEYLANPLYRRVAVPLRAWDQIASSRPDQMIAISHHVKNRIKKYYNRDVEVIYPPVDLKIFTPPTPLSRFAGSPCSYYLAASRLVPYKKLDLLIRAFNKLGRPLVIVGVGSESRSLRRLAGPAVKLVGFVEESELINYYHSCRAFVQVNEEDFGLAMVEAQAAGKPVIAYGVGGAAEIVKDGETGILFSSQSVAGICQAVGKFETMTFTPQACNGNAVRFDQENWKKLWQKLLSPPLPKSS